MSLNFRVKQRLQTALAQQSDGLLGLLNLFRKYDTDSSGSLSWEEFCSALQKNGLALSPQDIRSIFLDLDKDGNNEISYNEFVAAIRGDLSNARIALLKTIFTRIDEDNDGSISMTDIGKYLNPKAHPDVTSGRLTVNQLLKDFFESLNIVTKTGNLTLTQFIEYYSNIAAFIDDLKFTEIMNSIWNLKNTTSTTSLKSFSSKNNVYASHLSGVIDGSGNGNGNDTDAVLDQLKEQLKSRGVRGFVGLQRKFKIIDDDNNGTLNLVEFKKAMKECGLKLTDLQVSQLFMVFDRNRNGVIDFDEFLVTLRVS
jgi:Ca2+-binding EF-hand superfamily protein